MKVLSIQLLSGLLVAALPMLTACVRTEEDVGRASYRTSGGEDVEVEEGGVQTDDRDVGEEIEDEIFEESEGPYEGTID